MDESFLFPCVAHYYREPIMLTQGRGVRVRDTAQREYLDFFGGILTVSLGHCQPEVVDALVEQARQLGHTSTVYPSPPLLRAARKLAELTPQGLDRSFFVNSGTEANETAMLLARVHTGAHEIIALRHGYTGRTAMAMDTTGLGNWRLLPSSHPGIKHAPAPYCYRCPFGLTYPSCEVRCAKDLEEVITATTCGRPAAFLAEPILGAGGVIVPPAEYFQIAVGIVREHGGLFVCDEVQTGFGHTGSWFGIEPYGVRPDIMTFAKGIANGMPVGAVTTRTEIAASLTGPSISTFGGNPINMAAMHATLQTMQARDVPTRSRLLGTRLADRLEALADRHPCIGDVRGRGLMFGLELVTDRQCKTPATALTAALLEAAKAEGLLLGRGGRWGNVVRVAPPMLIEEADLDDGCERLARAFSALPVP